MQPAHKIYLSPNNKLVSITITTVKTDNGNSSEHSSSRPTDNSSTLLLVHSISISHTALNKHSFKYFGFTLQIVLHVLICKLSLMQDNTCTMSLVSRRRRSSITRPARLNVDSEDMVDAGTVKISFARTESTG